MRRDTKRAKAPSEISEITKCRYYRNKNNHNKNITYLNFPFTKRKSNSNIFRLTYLCEATFTKLTFIKTNTEIAWLVHIGTI